MTDTRHHQLQYDTNLRKKLRQKLFRVFEYEIKTQRAGFSHWIVNYRKHTSEILALIDQHTAPDTNHQDQP